MDLQITGIKELDKQLNQLEKKDLKKMCKKGLREGQKVIQKEVKENMPVDSGDAKKNIVVRAMPAKVVKKLGGTVGLFAGNTRAGFEKKTGKEFYLQYIENGNGDNEPQRPFQRALDAKGEEAKSKAISIIAQELNNYRGKK
ncbi:HK97-gp10 family putative phage morphogenesis protein [Rubinisphaera italica]|uniref:Phage protein, HK97 gp10 family n=1 Tax=Rubinisphaera italica TaxID=2527969 RepID=A0A5C5XP60_9PLAN|nr:HK97-gp10 family putative phage morphogenesis protein [Rubinisphaera italica]TWT64241.1 hypothetical protein Pan54_50020 [Rubinisphaera italica]